MTIQSARNGDLNLYNNSIECRDFHNVANLTTSERCHFVQTTDDCGIDDGFFNYITFIYCSFAGVEALGLILLFVILLILFVGLGVTADDFFCPSLTVIAKTLRLSDNIAGVTFLAFGNGAPDVFSTIAAIASSSKADPSLAIGALLGAGIFVTTVVAGTISIVKPFESMQRPLLRDIIFYLIAVFMMFVYLYYGQIALWQSLAFIGLYVIYVIVVTVGRYIRNKLKTREQKRTETAAVIANNVSLNADQQITVSQDSCASTSAEPVTYPAVVVVDGRDDDDLPLIDVQRQELASCCGNTSACSQMVKGLCPLDVDEWQNKGWLGKTYEIIKAPLMLIFNATIPVVDEDNWNKFLTAFQCTTAPLTCLFLINYKGALVKLGDHIPVWTVVLLAGILLSITVLVTTRQRIAPKFVSVFACMGFIVSVVWIYSLANEIVNILKAFGVAFNISDAILGLTLLAWGNSIGDMIANTVMAKQGSPRVGISACFGGPMFNLLLGIGISFTIQIIRSGKTFMLQLTLIQIVLLAGLTTSLLSSLIIVPLCNFRFTRIYGIYLLCLYVIFLLLAILVELNVIKGTI